MKKTDGHNSREIRVVLAGNPNSGKTTLFNNLTGLHQHVGNWPGKTVEKKEGTVNFDDKRFVITDLPGTYSLSVKSIEEQIARDFLIDESPDLVVNVIDASNLERNLYLSVQLLELGVNLAIVLNMNKYSDRRGQRIDVENFSKILGIPIIKLEVNEEKHKSNLLDFFSENLGYKNKGIVHYARELEDYRKELEEALVESGAKLNYQWWAVKLLEGDRDAIKLVAGIKNGDEILESAFLKRRSLEIINGDDARTVITNNRYGFIHGLIRQCVKRPKIEKMSGSERIDRIVTHKYFGLPIFLFAMYLLFQLTFLVSQPFVRLVDISMGALSGFFVATLSAMDAPLWIISLVSDAVIGGVGSVLVFMPIIMVMFFVISLLEDSGYMARAAFIMDKIMQKIGLHGKAFIPLLLGFGCTVPAVLATRTLEGKRERILTMLLSPMMSCGARLPVYVLFASAFFAKHQAEAIFSIYLLGIIMSVFMGLLFKKFLFKGDGSPFVMELPPYRLPALKGSLIHMWERAKLFMQKAGTVIFSAVLIVWFLSSVPWGVEYGSEQSAIGIVGKFVAPVLTPLGFGNWQSAVSLFFGLVAKEVIIGSMGTLYGVGESGIVSALQASFTPLAAYSFMVFVLLYVPCLTVLVTIRKETGTWRWPIFNALYLGALAWLTSFIIYQGGLLLGLG